MKARRRRRFSSRKQWSAREDGLIRTLYPDYRTLRKLLRTRSYGALRGRARTLGVAARRHVWTNRDVAKLERLYRSGATNAELALAFPILTRYQICSKARHIRLARTRREPYSLDIPPLDAIRKQASVQGLTWRRLDELARTGRYFQQTTRRLDWNRLASAVEQLSGTIEVVWRI